MIVLLSALNLSFGQPIVPILEWANRYNGPGNQLDEAKAVAVDASGNVYVTGYSKNSDGKFDYFTISYDSAGNIRWEARYDGLYNWHDYAYAIAVDNAGKVFVTGTSTESYNNSNIVTIAYNTTNGNQIWVASYDGPGYYNLGDMGTAIAVNQSNGNVYVTGYGTGPKSNPYNDYITLAYTNSGTPIGVARYDGPDNDTDQAWDVAIDSSGNVYVTGNSKDSANGYDYVTIAYNAALIQQQVWRYNGAGNYHDYARAVTANSSGSVFVTGQSLRTGGYGSDYVTLAYSLGSAIPIWTRTFGPEQTNEAYDIAVDGDGNVYVSGTSRVSASSYYTATVSYTHTGGDRWVRTYNSVRHSHSLAGGKPPPDTIVVDSSDNVYVTGRIFISYSDDFFVVVYDSAGNELWAERYEHIAGHDVVNDIAVDSSGNVCLTGMSYGGSSHNDYLTLMYSWIQNEPPVALCQDVTVEAGENCESEASIDNGSYDPDGDPITLSQDPPGPYPLGETLVTLTVTDDSEKSDICQATITVVDTTPPVPSIPALPIVTGECSAAITEVPTATDNCPSIITGQTDDPLSYTEQGEYVVTWTYTDSSGNSTFQTQTVIVADITPPAITLLGDNPMTIVRWSGPYIESGADVTDNCDEVPTLLITGEVDTNMVGVYILTYNASDSNGNAAAEVIRTVNVVDVAIPVNPYLLLADKTIKIESPTSFEWHLFSNDKIDIKKGPATYKGSMTAVDDIDIEGKNTIEGDVTSGSKIKMKKEVVVLGVVTENAPVVALPIPELDFSAGGDSMSVKEGQSENLPPGSYKKIHVKKNGELILQSGEYYVDELKLDKEAKLIVNVSAGPITINIVKKLEFKKDVEMVIPSGEADSRYVTLNILEEKELNIEEGAKILGSIVAPKTRVLLKKNIYLRGSIIAKEIEVQKDGEFFHHGGVI